MDEDVHPVVNAVTTVVMIAIVAMSAWCTVIAFAGGTIPLVRIRLHGGVGNGLVWLFFFDPIVITVGYWLLLVVVLPLGAIFRKRSR